MSCACLYLEYVPLVMSPSFRLWCLFSLFFFFLPAGCALAGIAVWGYDGFRILQFVIYYVLPENNRKKIICHIHSRVSSSEAKK